MSARVILTIILLSSLTFLSKAAVITADSNGNWTNNNTWDLGRQPRSGDEIVIPPGISVTYNIFGVNNLNLTGPEETIITIGGNLIMGAGESISIDDVDGDLFNILEGGVIDGATFFGYLPSLVFSGVNAIDVSGAITGPVKIQNGALPIELAHFDVIARENKVVVSWITASEENNDYFEILRSEDGEHYEVISKVKGAGSTADQRNYEFTDKNPKWGLSYYKLKQTDYDGKNETFTAKSIYVQPPLEFTFAPNPVATGENLQVYVSLADGESASFELLDVSGQILKTQSIQNQAFEILIPVGLERGVYMVRVVTSRTQHVKRLLVK